MSKPLFSVSVQEANTIYDMPDSWDDVDYQNLLALLEIDDVETMAGPDLLEVLLMALQDLDVEEAAEVLLAYKLEDSISKGSRQNIIQDLLEGQRPWEQISDITLHARIFAACVLLHKAFPGSVSRPDMMRVVMSLNALSEEAKALFEQPPEAAFVTRLLADGMDSSSILERLFDEQIAARHFPEAEGIIWRAEFSEAADSSAVDLTVYSSVHWLHDIESITDFESSAYNDSVVDEDDDD